MKKMALVITSLVLLLCTAQTVLAESTWGTKKYNNGTSFGWLNEDGKREGFRIYESIESHSYEFSYGMTANDKEHGYNIHIVREGAARASTGERVYVAGTYVDGEIVEGTMLVVADNGDTIHYAGPMSGGNFVAGKYEMVTNEYEWTTVEFDTGEVYTGEVKFGTETPHGVGIFTAKNGLTHYGEFTDGLPNGYGMQVDGEKSYFYGVWTNGLLVEIMSYAGIEKDDIYAAFWPGMIRQYGKLNFNNGRDIYYGWVNEKNQRDGFGVYYVNTPDNFEVRYGIFDDHKYAGYGVWIYDQENRPAIVGSNPKGHNVIRGGEFIDSAVEGSVRQLLQIDDNGDFHRIAGPLNAEGYFTASSGAVWMLNETEYAELDFGNGTTYSGEVKSGTEIPHGNGVYETEDGLMHVGQFTDGMPDGYGIQVFVDKSYFYGVWENGFLIEILDSQGLEEEDIVAFIWPSMIGLYSATFEYKAGYDTDWVTMTLPLSTVQISIPDESDDPGFVLFIFTDGTASSPVLEITVPGDLNEVFDSEKAKGGDYRMSSVSFRTYAPYGVYTVGTQNNQGKTEIFPANSSFTIEFTKGSLDGYTYEGEFSAVVGDGTNRTTIRNGMFLINLMIE